MNIDAQGWLGKAHRIESPNCDARPPGLAIDMIVVHSISLPPGEFGGDGVAQLFTNCLDPDAHPVYAELAGVRVSAHFFVRRDGSLLQFVSTLDRAWHAGASAWDGRERCNDFSIGIELEGGDEWPFEDAQYETLSNLISTLRAAFPVRHLVGHCDIAPGRKTDPGPYFDWSRLRQHNELGPHSIR